MDQFYDKIEAYLLGELNGSAFVDFEQALQTDTALAKSVAQHREMLLRLDALRLRKKVKLAVAASGPGKKPFYAFRIFWALAVLLLLLGTTVWWLIRSPLKKPDEVPGKQQVIVKPDTSIANEKESPVPNPGEQQLVKPSEKPTQKQAQFLALAREYYQTPASSFIRDAGGTNQPAVPKTTLQQAAEASEQKRYKFVADLLRKEETVTSDETARFLRANARFQLGQFAAAAQDFGILNNSFQFKQEARWNFLLCQLALGKNEVVKSLLTVMAQDPDFPFHVKALELKQKLNF